MRRERLSKFLWLTLLLLPAAHGGAASADEPRPALVAAASSLRGALEEIAPEFVRTTGKTVKLSYGATSNLAHQIEQGAPFELFLAADEESPARLVAAGRTEGEAMLLVRGRLVLAAPVASPVSLDGNLDGLRTALDNGKLRRFAIANPELAPYGRAAQKVLERTELWSRIKPHLVLGQTVAQAGQFLTSGGAEAGLIAQSLTLMPDVKAAVKVAAVPEDWYAPINQSMVLLKGKGEVAGAFRDFLLSPGARAVFEKHGFSTR